MQDSFVFVYYALLRLINILLDYETSETACINLKICYFTNIYIYIEHIIEASIYEIEFSFYLIACNISAPMAVHE